MRSATCLRCGRLLNEDEGSHALCSVCAIEGAEERIPDAPVSDVPGPQSDRRARFEAAFLGVLVVAFFVLIAIQGPGIVRAMLPASDQPPREGVQATDRATDECIENLAIAADEYASTGVLDEQLACPSSSRPYIARESLGAMTIGCPNPSAHELKSLSVDAGSGVVTAGE